MEILVKIVAPITAGFLGFFIKWILDRLNNKETREFERKEERYKKLMLLSIQLYREKNSSKLTKIKSELMQEYDYSWLYASDNVIKKYGVFIDSLRTKNIDSEKSMSFLAEAIIQMRKDLGNKTKLTKNNWNPRE